MKANETAENDGALRQVLHEWRVDTPLPPHFQEEVWRRIGRSESQAEPSSLWSALIRSAGIVLARPRCAFSCAAVLLVLGVAAGFLAAEAASHRLNSDLGLRYVQSLDPYRAGGLLP